MHKKDYQDKKQYTPAEWRHGICLRSCENVKIIGLTIKSSGGDGIYIGNCRKPINYCKDIVIKDCVIDDNHRQGISVISVINLLIENCVIKNTAGTPPQAGIDFEPNAKQERLFNITVRNCVFQNNGSSGVILCSHPNNDSEPISVCFENCQAIDNKGHGFSGGFGYNPPLDKIDAKMTNCVEIKNGKKRIYNDFWKDWQNMQVLNREQKEMVGRVKKMDVRKIPLKPVGGISGPSGKISIPALRGKSSYIAYVEKGVTLSFKTSLEQRFKKGMTIAVVSPSGKTISSEKIGPGKLESVSFTASESGPHIINFDPGGGWFSSRAKEAAPDAESIMDIPLETTSNIAMLAMDRPLHFFGKVGQFFFYVPPGVSEFYIQVGGQGAERVKASVYDGQGKLVETQDNISMIRRMIVSRKDNSKGEIWKLKTERPSEFYLEDYTVDLFGVPPILATDKACLLGP